jgi:hypothetical protein
VHGGRCPTSLFRCVFFALTPCRVGTFRRFGDHIASIFMAEKKSSAKVAVLDSGEVGRFAVYSRFNNATVSMV